MKKKLLAIAILYLSYSEIHACSWYEPDYEYFNLFTQNIIRDKSYTPFLLTYSARFYDSNQGLIHDENIEAWQKYFNNALNYKETEFLVNHLSINELNAIKSGKQTTDSVLLKLGNNAYSRFQEGFDYLIEAKYLEPFMRIKFVESPDTFYYYREDTEEKDATQLDYKKTIAALESLYNAAKNPEIKLRYGYQLVRFNHYTRNFQQSIEAFQKYVEPLRLKSASYYMALDQFAGAQRGLKNYADANWNFFQVFMHSKSRKQSAFVSMKLSDSQSFNDLLNRAKTPEEKNMAYFLLGYQDFNNPIPMMKKMYEIDPDSEILKVLTARAINELERHYLPTYYSNENGSDASSNAASIPETNEKKDLSFWQKIGNWFRNIFSSDSDGKDKKSNANSDKKLVENPNRIPIYNNAENTYLYGKEETQSDYLSDLEKMTSEIKNKSDDEFWKISDAYLKFLNKNYEESAEILDEIHTQNPEYKSQIQRMKLLNDISSQPKITREYEEYIYKKYKDFLVNDVEPIDSTNTEEEIEYGYDAPSTFEFLKDVLANRYFLQGEDAKSFLMNNSLSDFRYNPDLNLAKKLQAFYHKKDKSTFEKEVIAKNLDNIGNVDAFFNVVYGDFAMRNADFKNALMYYEKGTGFSLDPMYGDYLQYVKENSENQSLYNGFEHIPNLVFGHNVWESFESPTDKSMKEEDFANEFPLIKSTMNKKELAETVLELQKIGKGNSESAAKANQLLGNLLYNTSKLGYFRELFVMDINNSNGEKFHFNSEKITYKYYYKDYAWRVFTKPDNFDFAIGYYEKALKKSTNQDQKARILFQLASAEQGKYYQWEANQPELPYEYGNYEEWDKKKEQRELGFAVTKNQKYRTYFSILKRDYSNTETAKSLMGSCSYFDYFMKR